MQQRSDTDVASTRERQVELYGDSLNVLLGRCMASLQVTQARVAELLGVSAPMLSQLINGKRIKIGNPAAAQRLLWMIEIASQVESGQLPLGDGLVQLERNAETSDVVTGSTSTTGRRVQPLGSQVQDLFRRRASAAEWIEAATLLRPNHPEIAELLLVFGAERADRAEAYAERLAQHG